MLKIRSKTINNEVLLFCFVLFCFVLLFFFVVVVVLFCLYPLSRRVFFRREVYLECEHK